MMKKTLSLFLAFFKIGALEMSIKVQSKFTQNF